MATFWTGQDTEPKRNYRFQVTLTSFDTGGEAIIWYAKTFKTLQPQHPKHFPKVE